MKYKELVTKVLGGLEEQKAEVRFGQNYYTISSPGALACQLTLQILGLASLQIT